VVRKLIAKGLIFDFLLLVLCSALTVLYVQRVKKGKKPYIRPMGAISALPELVGRAAEMGRPIHFTSGRVGMTSFSAGTSAAPTIAALLVLGELSKIGAEPGVSIIATTGEAEVLPVAEEIVISAVTAAGHPEMKPDVRFLSNQLRSYISGCMGIISREKVAGNVVIGMIGMESLYLLDAGLDVGAMQIGGSASDSNAPWFVCAADYFLIGEEIIATAAYLGGDPTVVGSVAGEDVVKIIIMAIMMVGSILVTAGMPWLTELLKN